MALEYKDYYRTLNVAKTATEDEIRKSFRKLARVYHPDVAKNKVGTEDKFKEINEAYEVLGDPVKRRKYDALGSNWNQPGAESRGTGSRAGRRPHSSQSPDVGSEFGGASFSEFFEQLFNSNRGGRSGSAHNGQTDFSAQGQDVEAEILITLEEASRDSIRQVTLRRMIACSKCQGKGVVGPSACSVCGGSGATEQTVSHKVKISAGVREGQKLRLTGQGEPGSQGGKAGNLYLLVRFAKHPEFEARGDDLYHTLEIAPWEAVLGGNISVPTLEKPVNIRLPAGTQNGQKLRVRNKGLATREGQHGDLIVDAHIVIPTQTEPSQRELWEKLAETSNFNPRE